MTVASATPGANRVSKALASGYLDANWLAASLAAGALLFAAGSGAAPLSKLAIGTAGQVLTVNSGATAPQWSSALQLTSTILSKQASAAGIGLDPNSATGDFAAWLSPQNLTATRRYSLPDASLYMSGAAAALTANRLPSATGVYGVLQDSRIADGVTSGKVLTLVAANTYTLTVPESLTVAGRDVANTFTQLQTIDLGSGSTGISAGTLLQGWGADTGNVQIAMASFGNANGPTIYTYNVGGTRAVQSATANGSAFFTFIGRGHNGTVLTGSKMAFGVVADGAWTGSNNGCFWQWGETPSGSTTFTYGLRYQNHCLTLDGGAGGLAATAAAGLIQLASGTTIANGILFGDVGVYRNAANALTINATAGLTLTGILNMGSNKITAAVAVPGSFADLAAVQSYLASILT